MKLGARSLGRKVAFICGIVVLIVVAAALIYVAYVYISYYRVEDKLVLSVAEGAQKDTKVSAGTEYSIATYNIGFGAYTPAFSFFMDGGKSSVAESKESVVQSVSGAAAWVKEQAMPDFMLWQEVDIDGTRSYHINQYDILQEIYEGYDSVFAMNYDSPFLLYPFTEPHGKNKAGIVTASRFPVESAVRRSLPIATSFQKFFDLDRCYSVTRIPVDNGKYLCLFNVHMSAYGSDDSIRAGQIAMLCQDMEEEFAKGNYVICGGDFNHDLKAIGDDGQKKVSWAYPFPRESLPEGFAFCIDSFSKEEKEAMWDSARNADMSYQEGVTFTITLDGFIVSDNVECLYYENLKSGYVYSDHDPVSMRFLLK